VNVVLNLKVPESLMNLLNAQSVELDIFGKMELGGECVKLVNEMVNYGIYCSTQGHK